MDVAIGQKKITKEHLSNINDLWSAHKTKDKIINNPHFHLTQEETKKLIAIYEAAFKEWGVLE